MILPMKMLNVLMMKVGVAAMSSYAVASFQKPIFLPESFHDNKTLAVSLGDADGDGKQDAVYAGYAGDVIWAKNVGTQKEPKFEKGVKLFTMEHW